MSRIDRLSILGIRSFSHISSETIEFHTPLTLIVGYNGSGKTTIIECLKYATTGELPPNSKGGAFIHDPKLCDEREVMAQVRLKFKTPPSTQYVVTRNLQLTVKKTTRAFKTLEGTLLTVHNGERSTASSGVVKLDAAVPEKLGVAPAILESVIFCHQDDSLWPMSEPSALKKRFDEIFQALKYTKAIENIKVLRKRQGEDLGKLKVQEGQLKHTKAMAEENSRRCTTLEDQIQDLHQRCDEAAEQMEEAERSAKEMHAQALSFGRIMDDLALRRTKLEFHQDALTDSKSRMDELTESDEWLQDALAQHEERISRYQLDLEENTEQRQHIKHELTAARRDMSEKLAEQGKLQSDKAKYERQLTSRVDLVHQSARAHSIRGFEGDLDDQKVRSFYNRLQKLISDKKQELDRLQAEHGQEWDDKTALITELEGQKFRHTQHRVFAVQEIAKLEKQIAAAQRSLNAVVVDEGNKAILDSSFEQLEKRFEQASQDLQNANWDQRLQHENDHLRDLETENSRLSRELAESTRLLADRAQLDVRKNEVVEKKRKLDILTSTWNDKISALVDPSWKATSIEGLFQQALQTRVAAHADAARRRDDTQNQLKVVQSTLKTAKDKAKKRNEDIQRCKTTVLTALQKFNPEGKDATVDSLPKAIEDLEDTILTLEKDISLFGHLNEYYVACQKTMNKKNRCELCDRPFNDAGEKSKVAAKIKAALEDVKKEDMEGDLAMSEEQVGNLRAVRPQSDTYLRLSSEKVEADKEIRVTREKEESIVRALEELDEAVRQKEEERQDLESMSRTIANITQLHKDIDESEGQVERIVSQQQSSASVRSTLEINELQDKCGDQMKTVKNLIDKLRDDEKRMRNTVSALELERSQLRNKIDHAVRQLEQRRQLQSQIQNCKDDIVKQKEAIQQADNDLTSVQPEITKAQTIRQDAHQRGREKEKKITNERDGLAGSQSELKMVDSEIQDYLDRGGPANLAANERAIQTLETSAKRLDKDMTDLDTNIKKLEGEMVNSDGKKKNIVENLRYRQSLRDIEQLRREIQQLESRNANEDFDRLKGKAKAYEATYNRLNAERSAMLAEMRTKDEELAGHLKNWHTEFHDAAHRYRETHIKTETTKAAIEDLGRYSQALNNAIMKYHAIKMEEVNRIAGELWQSTYQGTDIDTILIKSDSETTTGRSTYNYRVCMVKQGTEMDMRGRCSAGQKVLASIIIRLALAESFGIGCGLIALDEPTTNLDRDNIRSLAESLHEIIRTRRVQSNFQLIVITHDEEFLRHMRCTDFCDVFYRVRRSENQNSVIERENIHNVV